MDIWMNRYIDKQTDRSGEREMHTCFNDSAAHRPSAVLPRVRCSTSGGASTEREVGQSRLLKLGLPTARTDPLRIHTCVQYLRR